MDILFWSGGKDALLALHFYTKQYPQRDLRLLTTYEEHSGIVPYQNITIGHIRNQAESLGNELIEVPLPADCPNAGYVREIKHALNQTDTAPEHLVFGDWYLQDIRAWREKVFGGMGYRCLFPIWQKDLHKLLPALWLLPVDITLSAVMEQYRSFVKVGETFDQAFVTQLQYLPEDIDPMGEKGEFHTKVSFPTPGILD